MLQCKKNASESLNFEYNKIFAGRQQVSVIATEKLAHYLLITKCKSFKRRFANRAFKEILDYDDQRRKRFEHVPQRNQQDSAPYPRRRDRPCYKSCPGR